jgi:hypothetical protein
MTQRDDRPRARPHLLAGKRAAAATAAHPEPFAEERETHAFSQTPSTSPRGKMPMAVLIVSSVEGAEVGAVVVAQLQGLRRAPETLRVADLDALRSGGRKQRRGQPPRRADRQLSSVIRAAVQPHYTITVRALWPRRTPFRCAKSLRAGLREVMRRL